MEGKKRRGEEGELDGVYEMGLNERGDRKSDGGGMFVDLNPDRCRSNVAMYT